MRTKIALVANALDTPGGLRTMTTFLYRALYESGRYQPEIISLATSASDSASVQLTSPKTWLNGTKIIEVEDPAIQYTHIGAFGSEIEFQRYRPRRLLRDLLQPYDLIQFVVGSPPWACVATDLKRPILVWTATTTRADRKSQFKASSFTKKVWSSFMIPITERYERYALKKVDFTFALSEYTLESIRPYVKPTQTALAPCGVDIDLFRPLNSNLSHNYILCVARLSDPRKNVPLLLKAYAMLKNRVKKLPDLYLVGDASSDSSKHILNELGITDKVCFVGSKEGEELASLYRNALFFALSSNEEGLGIVILEAMASGLPVVSTACGGPSTTIEDGKTGFLTPVGDVKSLSKAMETLITNSSLREMMGRAGRARCEEYFSIKSAGKIFLEKYEEILTKQNYFNSSKIGRAA
jgi:D-inositol-3-phosphate glycosyltransferase